MFDSYLKFCNPQIIERDFNHLIGILNGIRSDNEVNTNEITNIADWLTQVKPYENREPYLGLIQIVSLALEDYHLEEYEIDDIIWYCEKCISEIQYYNSDTSSIQQLYGILDGIISDGIINELEYNYLLSWLMSNQELEGKYPYDTICNILANSIVNKYLQPDELNNLKEFCKSFKVNKSQIDSNNSVTEFLKTNIFDDIIDNIVFEGSKMCITGADTNYKRSDIIGMLKESGAICTNTVTTQTDYLIVCDKRSHAWTYSMYGRKIEQAIALRKKSAKIRILHIEDLLKYL
jgi:NAD-dependent DNA ligase